jgi:hypothetical protein
MEQIVHKPILPIVIPEPAFYGRHGLMLSEMFGTTLDQFIGLKILDIPGGPSTLNQMITKLASRVGCFKTQVISCDPVYELPEAEIWKKAVDDINRITDLYFQHPQSLNPSYFDARTQLSMRLAAVMDKERHYGFLCEFMDDFISDKRLASSRYQNCKLPYLQDFTTSSFDLALVGHLLFTYANETTFNLDFHVESLEELTRVAKEVRVFPVGGLNGEISPILKVLRVQLQTKGIFSEVVASPNDMVKGEGWNQMLVLSRDEERIQFPFPMISHPDNFYFSTQKSPWKIAIDDNQFPSIEEVLENEQRWQKISNISFDHIFDR